MLAVVVPLQSLGVVDVRGTEIGERDILSNALRMCLIGAGITVMP